MARDRFSFRILGPLDARVNGERISLGGPKQRALLAILLLNANRVVSRERLIVDLQDERGDADRTLRVQVSRLRKVLNGGGDSHSRLITRSPGYLLRVHEGELDLHLFEALVVAGRQASEHGENEAAAVALNRAEALWRGPALAGLESEPFARGEIARLDELRLAAVEERIEADFTLGRHALLVPELEGLVAEHPLRERLRSQLMLALYRCGRQADALDAYREARSLLSDELALEPGPQLRNLERAILRQDEALELSSPPYTAGEIARGAETNRESRRNRRRGILAASVAMLAAVAVAVVLLVRDERDEPQSIDGNALALVSTASGQPVASTALDASPTRIASGAGSVWITHVDGGTVSRIDPSSRTVRQTIQVGSGPFGIAVAAGDVWVANSLDGTLSRIDPATNTVVQTIAVGAQPTVVVAAGRTIWVANRGDDTLLLVDAVSGRITRVLETGSEPSGIAVTGDTVWVSNYRDGTVWRIDAPSGDPVQTVDVGNGPTGIAATSEGVWVLNSLDATVSRIEPLRGIVAATIPVGGSPADISALGGSIWVSDADSGRVLQIDRDAVVRRASLIGERAGPVVATPDGTWIGFAPGGARHRGGTLTIASTFPDVRSLDPAVLDDVTPLALLGLTNDGLVTLNHIGGPDGAQLVPDLALSLPVASEDGRTYTFRLRPGIRYSTGEVVQPSDVRRSFERLFDLQSSGRSLYDRIVGSAACLRGGRRCNLSRGIVANDRRNSVTFHLVTSDPDFLFKLALPYAFVLPFSTPSRIARSPLAATGPYSISVYDPGREIRLVRNPRFRVWSSAAQPAGYPDEIVWRLGLSPGDAVRLVRRGDADLMSNIGGPPAAHIDELRIRLPRQLHSNPSLITDFFFLNTKAKPFDDLRVRRALNFAIDRNRIVAIYGGPATAQPTCQILPPQMPGFSRYCPYTRDPRSDGRWHAPDLQKARRLIAASGTKGMVVKVWGTPTPTISLEQGRYVTAVLRRLGYRASLHVLPDAAFYRYTDNSRNKAQVVSGGWSADHPSPSTFIGKLTCGAAIPNSKATFNTSQFCDPGFDRQVRRAELLQMTNRPLALAAWRRLDRELTDRAVWLPTVTVTLTDIVSKRVGNYQFHTFWGVLVDQLWVR